MTRMSQSNSKSRAAGAGFAFPVSPERPPAEFCSEPWTGGRLCPPCLSHTFVGADAHIGPFVRIHRTSSVAVTLQLCLQRPTFSVLPEKVGKKRRRGRAILRAHARDFLAAPRPERPIRAQDCDRSNSFRFRQMYYTHLRVDCDNFGSAHFRNTRPILFMYCTLFVFHTRL